MTNTVYTTLKQAMQIRDIRNEARQNAGKYGKMPPLREIAVVINAEETGFYVVTLGFASKNELEVVK